MIRHAATTWLAAGLRPTLVVVSQDRRLREAVANLPLTLVENANPEWGISQSIALGVGEIESSAEAALIGVGDQPSVTADALGLLIAAFRAGRIVVARYGDHTGTPVLFDRRFFSELRKLEGDHGGQQVVKAHPGDVIEVELPESMGRDIDRPEEWPA